MLRETFIALLLLSSVTADCAWLLDGNPEARELADCTWYSQSSCCSVEDSEEIKKDWEGGVGNTSAFLPKLYNFVTGCIDKLHFFPCSQCSGNQSDFIGRTEINKQSYCDGLYSSCGLATADGDEENIQSTYADGTDFCERVLPQYTDLNVEVSEDMDRCFNAAHQPGTLFAIATALLFLVNN